MPDEHPEGHKELDFRIQIDRAHYEVHQHEMTGVQLRHVPPTPIGPDPDRKISDTDVVKISNGKRFFTAPAHINPGASA
jgi:hypothetical protein